MSCPKGGVSCRDFFSRQFFFINLSAKYGLYPPFIRQNFNLVNLRVAANLNEPEFTHYDGFKVIVWRPAAITSGEATGEVSGEATEEDDPPPCRKFKKKDKKSL